MKGFNVVAEILRREGVEFIVAYPVNPIIDGAAEVDIRTIIVRQERTGLHMADGFSRLKRGKRIGVFTMQWGPGTENAFGGVAQAYGESVPILVLPGGYARNIMNMRPNFSAFLNFQHVTKWIEQTPMTNLIPDSLRRAFTQVKNGRPGPALVEIPRDVLYGDFDGVISYMPTYHTRTAPDAEAVRNAARMIAGAKRPMLHVGQGINYAEAWKELRELAELIQIPVMTTLQAKSSFPENHPLALGAGGFAYSKTVKHFLENADVICGIGCSFARSTFATPIPAGKVIIHSTNDPGDLNKDVPAQHALIGDAQLVLQALIAELKSLIGQGKASFTDWASEEIRAVKKAWLDQWMPKLTSNEEPLCPYRVIWDLMHTVDRANTIITHDAGSPRDQLAPFWECIEPMTYIGWGKTTQLGYGLGLAMGAKLAEPQKICINVMGDAAIGFTGMDFETAVREKIPIITVVLNNYCMAMELDIMKTSTQKYRSTDISGNYADMAKAFGGYGERVTATAEIVPAIKRAIRKNEEGVPVLLEFITSLETSASRFI